MNIKNSFFINIFYLKYFFRHNKPKQHYYLNSGFRFIKLNKDYLNLCEQSPGLYKLCLHGTCRYYRIISVRQKRGFSSHGHWVHCRSHGVSEKILSVLCIRYLTEPFQGLSTFLLYKILFDISTLIKKAVSRKSVPLITYA